MKKSKPRYTLRVPKSMLTKLAYTSEYNGRTKNKEIEYVLQRYLNDFERFHGQIPNCEDEE